MNPDQAQAIAPFERRISQNDGAGQKWQVEPKDIRQFVEENLLGKRSVEQEEYALIPKNRKEDARPEDLILARFWERTEEEAIETSKELCRENGIFYTDIEIVKTGRDRKKSTQVKEPLMNEVGAYHILGIIEGVFSRIGYLSNLSGNEINDIMYDDILTNLVISIMKSYEKYGVTKGSREEIVGFITSTCQLILNSSREGWTGNRFGQSVQEQIVTKQESGDKGIIKKILS